MLEASFAFLTVPQTRLERVTLTPSPADVEPAANVWLVDSNPSLAEIPAASVQFESRFDQDRVPRPGCLCDWQFDPGCIGAATKYMLVSAAPAWLQEREEHSCKYTLSQDAETESIARSLASIQYAYCAAAFAAAACFRHRWRNPASRSSKFRTEKVDTELGLRELSNNLCPYRTIAPFDSRGKEGVDATVVNQSS